MAEANIKCYTVRIETPYAIQQYVETTWAGLPEDEYREQIKDTWEEFESIHNVEVDIKVTKVPCSKVPEIRRYFKKKKRRSK